MGTSNAQTALSRLREAGATLHNDEVVLIDAYPPMFFFADPDGNGLVSLGEESHAVDQAAEKQVVGGQP